VLCWLGHPDGARRKLSYRERVARMYAPEVTPQRLKHLTSDAASDPGEINQAIALRCRRPRTDLGAGPSPRQAAHHPPRLQHRRRRPRWAALVSVQRSIDEFIVTRTAMNASGAHFGNREITATRNNGINGFIVGLRRANYVLPSRAGRSFPLLSGRAAGLD
jgi:hypothetical protein